MLYAASSRRRKVRIQRQASARADSKRSLIEHESSNENSSRARPASGQSAVGSHATQRPTSAASISSQKNRPGSAISIGSLPNRPISTASVSSPNSRPASTISLSSQKARPTSATSILSQGNGPIVGNSPSQRRSVRKPFQIANPINGLRRISFPSLFKTNKTSKETKPPTITVEESSNNASSAKKKGGRQINPKDFVLAERERVNEIKELMESKDYDAALSNLMSDTDEDLHYFNQVKREALGNRHDEAFLRKHGSLHERPAPAEEPNTCIWMGVNDFGHSLRCRNKCLYHPNECVTDPLGVERPKPLDYCVYHVKYCVDTDNHAVPIKVRIPNDMGLCNQCFVLRNGHPPEALLRVPGTRRKLG
mmetsp:Transcript_16165/g.34162  ORF Transcript_16165/g.34162 Transcript_16165/m.34162 type:complete len:366 (+) Transcript_16165:169-1266(+)